MSTLRTTNVIHGSSAISNIVLDNQGRAIFGPDSPAGRAALYVNAQTNRVGINNETPSVALDVDGAINATGNATIGGTLNLSGDVTVGSTALFVDASDKSVGIGTSSISTGSALTIAGKGLAITGQNQAHGINSLRLGEEPGGLGEIRCYGSGSDKGSLRFRMSTIDGLSNSDIIIDSDGQLGINTSTITNVKLQINGPLSSTSGTGLLGFGSASTPLFAVRLDDPNADLHIDRSYAGFQATPVVVINRQYGNVGLNTLPNTNVGYALAVSSTTNTRITVLPPSDEFFGQLILGDDDKYIIGYGITHPGQPNELSLKNINATGKLTFRCGGDNERLRITDTGNIGINTSSPSDYSNGYKTITINGTGTRGAVIDFKTGNVRYGQISNTTSVFNMQSGENVPITVSTGSTQSLKIVSDGTVLCGAQANGLNYPQPNSTTDTRKASLQIQHRLQGLEDAAILLDFQNNQSDEKLMMGVLFNSVAIGPCIRATVENSGSNAYGMKFYTSPTYLSPQLERMNIGANGTITVPGSLTVSGTKNFNIKHPLASKKETHTLIHTCIEGPRADLIYRGKVQLVNGEASVNIDESATMTEGTFEVLARNVQCFTTNETDWCPIKGSVTKNILTITAKDVDCSAVISWMVIGERKDQQIVDAVLTDENGHVIVELLNEDILKRGTVLAE